MIQDTSGDTEQMEEKAETLKKDFQNNLFDDEHLKRLWFETYDYRQNFIKQNTTADIVERFPVYSNPSMVIINCNTHYQTIILGISRC
jgi:hypothetical protein